MSTGTSEKDKKAHEKTHEKGPYDFYEKPAEPGGAIPQREPPLLGPEAQPPPVVTPAATASLFVIPPMKSLNDELGALTMGATMRPGLSALQTALPVTPQNMQNGGMPLLARIMPLVGDGANYYLPLPKNSIILSISTLVIVPSAAGLSLVFGNDTPVGANDFGSFLVATAGYKSVPTAASFFTGILGNNLQMTTPVDANLQGIAFIYYVVRGS